MKPVIQSHNRLKDGDLKNRFFTSKADYAKQLTQKKMRQIAMNKARQK